MLHGLRLCLRHHRHDFHLRLPATRSCEGYLKRLDNVRNSHGAKSRPCHHPGRAAPSSRVRPLRLHRVRRLPPHDGLNPGRPRVQHGGVLIGPRPTHPSAGTNALPLQGALARGGGSARVPREIMRRTLDHLRRQPREDARGGAHPRRLQRRRQRRTSPPQYQQNAHEVARHVPRAAETGHRAQFSGFAPTHTPRIRSAQPYRPPRAACLFCASAQTMAATLATSTRGAAYRAIATSTDAQPSPAPARDSSKSPSPQPRRTRRAAAHAQRPPLGHWGGLPHTRPSRSPMAHPLHFSPARHQQQPPQTNAFESFSSPCSWSANAMESALPSSHSRASARNSRASAPIR